MQLRGLPLLLLVSASGFAQTNYGVSVDSAGNFGTGFSYFSVISSDGRYVAYQSQSSNLVANDSNGRYDIFRYDLMTGVTELVSLRRNGTGSANGLGLSPDISGDGRYVVWSSDAPNIVAGDTNGTWDVFLRDMVTGMRERISVTSTGAQASLRSDGPRITPDGRFVVFESDDALVPSDLNGQKDVYRVDRQTGALDLVSVTPAGGQGNSWSYHGDVSDDGRYVVFTSTSDDLVAGDTNQAQDVFLRDRLLDTTERLNLSLTGGELDADSWVPQMTPDVRVITYTSEATNIVMGNTYGERQIFARDLASGPGVNFCTANPNSSGAPAEIRAAGSRVFAANDLTLEASSLPRLSFCFFLASQTQDFVPNPAGSQGNLCLGGQVGRYVGPGQVQNSGTAGTLSLTLDLTAIPQPNGFVSAAAGETWNFQAWTRDSFFGAPTSNFTNGVSVTLQ